MKKQVKRKCLGMEIEQTEDYGDKCNWVTKEYGLPIFGDIDYRLVCPLERAEQTKAFNYIRRYGGVLGQIALHPRNEGKRTFAQARFQKREGLTGGACDILIPSRKPFLCEIKRLNPSKSKVEKGQVEFLYNCKIAGGFSCFALGAIGAVDAFNYWRNHYHKSLLKAYE